MASEDARRAAGSWVDGRSRRGVQTLAVAALIAGSLTFLDNTSAIHAAEWGVAAYLSGEAGLEMEAGSYWQVLQQAANAGACDVAIQLDGNGAAARWSVPAGRMPNFDPLGPVDMASGAEFRSFIRWATAELGTTHTALIILGHGSGVATLAPERSGVAEDRGSGGTLSIGEIAGAIQTERTRAFDLISLEACYAASLETAWALRDCTHYIIGSPGLVYSPGLPWEQAITNTDGYGDGAAVGTALCEAYSGSLVCARIDRLRPISEQLTAMVRLMLGNMELHSPVLRLERSRTQSWGYRDELCDVGELARRLSAGAASEAVAVAASELDAGVRGAVVAQSKAVRDKGVSGVGLFFPASWEPIPSHYAQTYQFAQRTGWGDLLVEHYRVSGRGLIR